MAICNQVHIFTSAHMSLRHKSFRKSVSPITQSKLIVYSLSTMLKFKIMRTQHSEINVRNSVRNWYIQPLFSTLNKENWPYMYKFWIFLPRILLYTAKCFNKSNSLFNSNSIAEWILITLTYFQMGFTLAYWERKCLKLHFRNFYVQSLYNAAPFWQALFIKRGFINGFM